MYSTHDITVLKGQCSWLGTRSCISAITSLASHSRLTWQKPNSIQQNGYRSSKCGVILTLWFYYKQTRNCINSFLTIVFMTKFYTRTVIWTRHADPWFLTLKSIPASQTSQWFFFFFSTKTNMNQAGFLLFDSWKQLWGKWEGESYFQHLNRSHNTVASRPYALVWGASVSPQPTSQI